jgi:hypothetical protein
LDFLARHCRRYMFLETCVSYGDDEALHPVSETRWHPSQAVSGVGCRPTRPWLFKELKRRFQNVYVPRTQPNHEEFPIDWSVVPASCAGYVRSVFICARQPIENEMLVEELLASQSRHA